MLTIKKSSYLLLMGKTMINDYHEVTECVYKDEHYSVRDNGAVMRHLREGKKARRYDEVWTLA